MAGRCKNHNGTNEKDEKMYRRKYVFIFLLIIALSLVACVKENNKEGNISKKTGANTIEEVGLINKNGETILKRYNPPRGFTRTLLEEGSFGEFLRNSELKPYGQNVKLYDGREKIGFGRIYDSVFQVDIGDADLHQCADAIMLLRAEYLYAIGDYDSISFNFASGFKAEYSKWRQGNRIKIDGNNVSYYKGAEPDNSYESFRKYMTIVMAYANTMSLERELTPLPIEELSVGDVFIIGGNPGHGVIVVDLVEEIVGNDKLFLLAQSYMPAQETQILMNNNEDGKIHGPWYSLEKVIDGKRLKTPEWVFDLDKVRTWE